MDEPFSALDVLTAENLRSELVRLWEGKGAPVKSILIVTHNIEEAVLLADRVLVLSSNPGRIMAGLAVDLPRPRDRHAPRFEALVDSIYDILTGREEAASAVLEEAHDAPVWPAPTPINTPLPDVTPGGLAGLLEILAARGGRDGLAELADELSFEVDDLLPLTDAAELLRLTRIDGSDIELRPEGREFAAADILASKQLFARQAAKYAPSSVPSSRHSPLPMTAICAPGSSWTSSAALLRAGSPQPARHRPRVGPLRGAVRLRQRRRPDHARTWRHELPVRQRAHPPNGHFVTSPPDS